MSFATLEKSLRNALIRGEIAFNRARGREFVPVARDLLHIETSSACNLKCRFCAYDKKQSPRVVMSNAMFVDCVEQALELGMNRFELTPCTGDVFMDRRFFEKLDFLDAHPGVRGYRFFTNFTIPRPRDVERLLKLARLEQLTISVYGHDLESFVAIAVSSEKIYRRLIANLEALLKIAPQRRFGLDIGLRSSRNVPRRGPSELLRLLNRYEQAGIKVGRSRVYNNWGGYISQADVQGLDIDITGADTVHKSGACSLLLTTVQVMATGIVNGCACRDVDATLRIGDIRQLPLREILSPDNEAYMRLIDEQQRGEFRPICRTCDFYKSIYHHRAGPRKNRESTETLAEFMQGLGALAARSGTR